jgi:hypothetical protein
MEKINILQTYQLSRHSRESLGVNLWSPRSETFLAELASGNYPDFLSILFNFIEEYLRQVSSHGCIGDYSKREKFRFYNVRKVKIEVFIC